MNYFPFLLLIIISAFITISSKYKDSKLLLYIFKPIPLLILSILLYLNKWDNDYSQLIFCGFVFSLLGDIFLMFPKKLFLAGLVAFLIAHLFFVKAFILGVDDLDYLLIIPVILFGIGYYLMIKDVVGKMKWPVLFYISVICIMLGASVNRWIFLNDYSSFLVMVGSILFVVSDSLLAYNKFKSKFYFADILVLSTYFSAQILFFYSAV